VDEAADDGEVGEKLFDAIVAVIEGDGICF